MNQFQLLGRVDQNTRFASEYRAKLKGWSEWGKFPTRKQAETVMAGHTVNYPHHEFKVVPK